MQSATHPVPLAHQVPWPAAGFWVSAAQCCVRGLDFGFSSFIAPRLKVQGSFLAGPERAVRRNTIPAHGDEGFGVESLCNTYLKGIGNVYDLCSAGTATAWP